MHLPDYYKILGIDPDAGAEEIKSAYRSMARKYHPDVYHGPHSGELIKAINAAYCILSDKELRRKYDLKYKYGTVISGIKTHPRDPRAYNYSAYQHHKQQQQQGKPLNMKKLNNFIFYSFVSLLGITIIFSITDLIVNFRPGGIIFSVICVSLLIFGMRSLRRSKH